MRIIVPPIQTLAQFHSLIQYWDRVGYNHIKLTPYKTLSGALRKEVCEKLGLGIILPAEADLGAIQRAIEGTDYPAGSNIRQMSNHFAVRGTVPECGEMIAFILFILNTGNPVLAITIGDEWNVLFDDR